MGFNPMVYARLLEKNITKKNHLKNFFANIVYYVNSYTQLPMKMKLLDYRINDYKTRINKMEKAMENGTSKTNKGKNMDILR